MQLFVNIFLLSGVILGIVLNFAPELFNGVAVKSSSAPVLDHLVSSVADSASPVASKVTDTVSHNGSGSANVSPVLTKVVNIVINDHPFTLSLESIDKNTIITTARKLCINHAAELNIRLEDVENGCVGAVADHIFRDVFSGELKEYPVTVSIPINDVGVFDLQFDMMKTSPRQVALSFCQGKREELNIATEELLLNGCVPTVEQFIVDELVARGVIDAPSESAVAEVAASETAPATTEHVEPVADAVVHEPVAEVSVPEPVAATVEHTDHIPFTSEEEAALKVAEEEIAQHHHHEEHHEETEPAVSLESGSVPTDVSDPQENHAN